MIDISARERRLLALAILVLVVAVIWVAGVAPILNGFAARQEARDAAIETLRHNARGIADYSDVRLQLEDVRRTVPNWAVQASSRPAATDLARRRISQAVADSGGVLDALRDQPGQANLIRLQVDARIDLNGLQTLLRHLENDRPAGVVNSISVAAADATTAQPVSSPSVSSLQVRLDVSFSYVPPR
jgi:uncharacterized protein YggE